MVRSWPTMRDRAHSLEEDLALHEGQLRELEHAMMEPLDSSAGAQAGHAGRFAECQELGQRLQEVAATALEAGCSRSVPGAMDIFEQANAGVERVGRLLQRCTPPPEPQPWNARASSSGNTVRLDHATAFELPGTPASPSGYSSRFQPSGPGRRSALPSPPEEKSCSAGLLLVCREGGHVGLAVAEFTLSLLGAVAAAVVCGCFEGLAAAAGTSRDAPEGGGHMTPPIVAAAATPPIAEESEEEERAGAASKGG
uniref:Uncharacterized protein n=1 Tax=Pyrodinium bahamense TaxID=73915 RepID=A0A7S0AH65_9DINO